MPACAALTRASSWLSLSFTSRCCNRMAQRSCFALKAYIFSFCMRWFGRTAAWQAVRAQAFTYLQAAGKTNGLERAGVGLRWRPPVLRSRVHALRQTSHLCQHRGAAGFTICRHSFTHHTLPAPLPFCLCILPWSHLPFSKTTLPALPAFRARTFLLSSLEEREEREKRRRRTVAARPCLYLPLPLTAIFQGYRRYVWRRYCALFACTYRLLSPLRRLFIPSCHGTHPSPRARTSLPLVASDEHYASPAL